MTSSQVVVAPREIADLVDRASRAHECSVADAARLAADVAFCEIHHSGGLAAWLDLAANGPGALTVALDAARALDRVALDTLEGTPRGALGESDHGGAHRFAEPVPYALLARSQAAWAQRGVALDIAADGGIDPVLDVLLRRGVTADRPDHRRRWRDVLAQGVAVDRTDWVALGSAGARFLMPEAELDAAR